MLWVTVGEPNNSVEDEPAVLICCKHPGAPRKPRSMPGLIWPKLRMCPVRTVAAGTLVVVKTTVLPMRGDGEADSASASMSAPAENEPGRVAEMSRLPGSSDGPP